MAHFAKVDENNIVQQVIVIDTMHAPDPAPENSEILGQHYILNVLNLPGTWIQTSYNGSFRGYYAGSGYIWDPEKNAFYPPKPYKSWTLDENLTWQPPIPYPNTQNKAYLWNEENMEWIELMDYKLPGT